MADNYAEEICKTIPKDTLHSPLFISHLDEIALHLESWEHLAPNLHLSSEEETNISKDYAGHYRIQKQRALRAWRSNLGDRATLESLIFILCNEAKVALAETLKEVIGRRPTCLPIFAKYVREYYKFDPNVYAISEKTLCRFDRTHTYVELILHEVLTDATSGSMSSESSSKVVKLNSVLNNQSKKITILFEGVAGSGKTTLSLHVCLQWAEGKLLQQFQLLIHVQLGDPRVQSAKSLADLIPDIEKEMRDEVAAAIIDVKGEGVCFLMEGLDEAPDDLWNSFLFDFISGEDDSLLYLSFILTSRPGCQQLNDLESKLTSKIVIKGFDKKGMDKFFDSGLGSTSNERNEATKRFMVSPRLEALCSLPMNAAILTFLVHFFKKELPDTQTGLCKLLVSNFLARHIQTRTGTQELMNIENFRDDLQEYPDIKEAFQKLCSLSYSALLRRVRFFTMGDLHQARVSAENGTLGLLQIQTKATLLGRETIFCFPHLSLQEFLAAVHLSLMNDRHQAFKVEQIFRNNPLSPVLLFYAGLTGLANREALEVLSGGVEVSLDAPSVFEVLRQNMRPASDPRRKALALFNCLYESQNNKAVTDLSTQLKTSFVVNNIRFIQIALNAFNMTTADCLALGYYVRNAMLNGILNSKALFSIDVALGKCSEIGMTSFLSELKKSTSIPNPYVLHKYTLNLRMFDYVAKEESSQLALRQLFKGLTNVLVLKYSLGPDVTPEPHSLLKCTIEGMAPYSLCFMLSIQSEGLSQSCVHYLTLLLVASETLGCFSLQGLNLQHSMPLISEALRFSNLHVIALGHCNIDDLALASLGRGVSRNRVLHELHVNANKYTAQGVIQFLKLLISKETVLSKLAIEGEIYAQLPLQREYHKVILNIIALRMVLKIEPLKIVPKVLDNEVDDNTALYAENHAKTWALINLPQNFTRRE